MFRRELVDSNAYINLLDLSDWVPSEPLSGWRRWRKRLQLYYKEKKIYFNKKATKGAQLAFIDTTAWVMLSKMLFITVHLVVHRVHVIFY